jgi:hypothetical protein
MAQSSTARAWARGGVVLAATLLILIGIFQIFMGIAAIIKQQFFVLGPNYAYVVNTHTWGWIHLGIGIVATLTGFFLFTGILWARIIGVAIAVLSAVANFFFVPYYPIWSLLIIAVDIFAIWAIANAGRDVMTPGYDATATGQFAGESEQTGSRWPATNQPTGRHYAEPAKEGTGNRAAAEREQAEAMAQRYQGGNQPGQGQPPSGQQGMGQPGQPGMPRDPGYPSS